MTATRAYNPWQDRFQFEIDLPGVAAVAATGLITCATNANMADSDYITLNDGFRILSYEYDKAADGVTAGRASWAAGASTAADVAATLKTAIEANQPAFTVTDNADGTLTLTHNWPGAGGNKTITENVAHASFTVAGMTGGAGPAVYSATTTVKVQTAQRKFRVDRVEYINPVGLAGHASNYWEIALKKGSTTIAQWSTDSDVVGQGTLTANTFVDLVNASGAALVVDRTDVLSVVLTKVASAANLPAGRMVVHARYVS